MLNDDKEIAESVERAEVVILIKNAMILSGPGELGLEKASVKG